MIDASINHQTGVIEIPHEIHEKFYSSPKVAVIDPSEAVYPFSRDLLVLSLRHYQQTPKSVSRCNDTILYNSSLQKGKHGHVFLSYPPHQRQVPAVFVVNPPFCAS